MTNFNYYISPINQKYPLNRLNKDTSVNNKDIDYVKIHNHYMSLDPRTFDSPRAQRLEFDAPPRISSGTIPQTNIYEFKTNQTGFYNDYQSIHGGDIIYYTDIDNDEPNSGPQFFIPAYTNPTLLIDPMGSVKPYYLRIPIFEKNNTNFEYTFDQDQCEFREDLMALQQQKINRSQFGAFQLYNDPKTYYPNYNPNFNGQFPLFNHQNH